MSLLVQIDEDLKTALRAGDKNRLSVLRMLRSAVKYKQIDSAKQNSEGREKLSEEEVVSVIDKEVKKRKESVAAYRGKRDDLADQEQAEMEMLEAYLPAGVSEEEIKQAIGEVLKSGETNQGKIIGMVMGRLKGKRVDGGRVKTLVENSLKVNKHE